MYNSKLSKPEQSTSNQVCIQGKFYLFNSVTISPESHAQVTSIEFRTAKHGTGPSAFQPFTATTVLRTILVAWTVARVLAQICK